MKNSDDFRWRTASDSAPQLSILLGGRHRPLSVNILSLLPCGDVCIWCQLCTTVKVEPSILIPRVLIFRRIVTLVNIWIVNVIERGISGSISSMLFCQSIFFITFLSEGMTCAVSSPEKKQKTHEMWNLVKICHVLSCLHDTFKS